MESVESALSKLSFKTGDEDLKKAVGEKLDCCENVIIYDNEGKTYLSTFDASEEELK